MKNSPKKDDKNSKRIQDQQRREKAIRKGDPGSSTPQGAGVGNSTQSAINQPGSEDLLDFNPRFEPIDPESERSSAEQHKEGKVKSKKKALKSKKENNASTDEKQQRKKAGSAHWEGEGEPGYASSNTHQSRQWLEKED